MSKLVRDLQVKHLRHEFDGASDLLFVDLVGMTGVESTRVRLDLRKKGIHLRVVKNRLARKVLDELGVARAASLLRGPSAIAWGGPGIVELAREITEWAKRIQHLKVKGGLVAGEVLDANRVTLLSTMPSKPELLGRVVMLMGSPAARVAALATAPASRILSQLRELARRSAAGGEPSGSNAA
jgi:large subunit ribosomal protein L10